MHIARPGHIAASLILAICSLFAATPAFAAGLALDDPSEGASFRDGKAISFAWNGDLPGDAGAIDRSFFRVEIARAADVPGGRDAEWTKIVNWVMTEPGAPVTTASMAAPEPGSYRWRVCGWGVLDTQDTAKDNALEQLQCTDSRLLTATAIPENDQLSRIEQQEERTVVPATPTKRSNTNTSKVPSVVPAIDSQSGTGNDSTSGSARYEDATLAPGGSELGLRGSFSLDSDGSLANALKGIGAIGDQLLNGLMWKLPGIGLPFWALLLFLLPVPLTLWWRRTAVRMFDLELPASSAGTFPTFKPTAQQTDASGVTVQVHPGEPAPAMAGVAAEAELTQIRQYSVPDDGQQAA